MSAQRTAPKVAAKALASPLNAPHHRRRCPAKIDIGPVYNVDPSKRQAYQSGGGFVPVERELVFDIDMDGYDDVRVCCKGSSLCHR